MKEKTERDLGYNTLPNAQPKMTKKRKRGGKRLKKTRGNSEVERNDRSGTGRSRVAAGTGKQKKKPKEKKSVGAGETD